MNPFRYAARHFRTGETTLINGDNTLIFREKLGRIVEKLYLCARIGFRYALAGAYGIKWESGASPGQSRCCEAPLAS